MTHTGEDRHFIDVIRDMSESRASQERLQHLVRELEETQAELVRSNKELDNFAYLASHDLRAPLRAIRNAACWLEEDLADKLDDTSRGNLDLLRNRVERMDRLLSDLLEHSRIGRVDHVAAEITGAELIDNLRELSHGARGLRVEASPALLAGTYVQMPLQTVLLNLVSNAMKHHDKTEGRIYVDVTTTDDGAPRFSVTDDGPGIEAKYHERIFEIFQTLRSRDHVEGSGMGLAMVKKYVALAGGEIEIRSEPGAGSRFAFTWPGERGRRQTGSRLDSDAA